VGRRDDVVGRFGFLVEEFGFAGPDVDSADFVGYSAPPWSVWVSLDIRNRTVETTILHADAHLPLGTLIPGQTWAARNAPDGPALMRSSE